MIDISITPSAYNKYLEYLKQKYTFEQLHFGPSGDPYISGDIIQYTSGLYLATVNPTGSGNFILNNGNIDLTQGNISALHFYTADGREITSGGSITGVIGNYLSAVNPTGNGLFTFDGNEKLAGNLSATNVYADGINLKESIEQQVNNLNTISTTVDMAITLVEDNYYTKNQVNRNFLSSTNPSGNGTFTFDGNAIINGNIKSNNINSVDYIMLSRK